MRIYTVAIYGLTAKTSYASGLVVDSRCLFCPVHVIGGATFSFVCMAVRRICIWDCQLF